MEKKLSTSSNLTKSKQKDWDYSNEFLFDTCFLKPTILTMVFETLGIA